MSYVPVSIVIPAWNEKKSLKTTLQALLHIDYDRRLCEVIVVAGGNDDTYEIARDMTEVIHVFSRYVVLLQTGEGKNAAIQQGIKEAENSTIVLLDADTIVSEQWLEHMVAPIEQGTCDLTIANPEPLNRSWVSDYYMLYKAYVSDKIMTYPGNAIAFRASVVEDQLEYFFDKEVKVGVDYLLEKRFLEQGRKIAFVKDASVITRLPSSLKYFVLTESRWLTALINIDGVSYRALVCNSAVVAALIWIIPFSKALFILSFLFNCIYIAKRVCMFLIGSRRYETNLTRIFGFILLSYTYHVIGFVCYIRYFLGLSKKTYLYQGQRY